MRWFALAALVIATPAAADDVVHDVPQMPALLGVTVTASSSAKGDEPWYALYRGDPTKFWCEGRTDEGIGESLELKLSSPTKLDSIVIRAGVWRSPELFEQHNRISEMDVVTDDGRVKKVKLNDARENVEVSVGRGQVSSLKLEIASVVKGKKVNDTCISGI